MDVEQPLNMIPPGALLVLNTTFTIAVLRRRMVGPALSHPGLALVCALGPALYGLGALLYLLLGEWRPGIAFGALGTFAVPVAIAFTLNQDRGLRALLVGVAAAVWATVWIPALRPIPWDLQVSALAYAIYAAVAIAVAALGLRQVLGQELPDRIARRVFGLALPFLALGLLYLLVKGTVLDPSARPKPIFSSSIHVGAEVILLLLLAQGTRRESPTNLTSLLIQSVLLLLGAVLLLVLAANLGVFPRAPLAMAVAAGIATAMGLTYGMLRPSLDRFLKDALGYAFSPEAHRAERRLQTLQGELEAARDRLREVEHLSLVGQLAAQVAHEIKNPLGPIKGYTTIIEREALKAGALTEKIQRGVEIIRQEVEAIDARARGLLELARPPQPRVEAVDFVDLGQDVLDLVAAETPPGVRLDWGDRPDAAPGRGDPLLLRSAITNVVQNALQVLEGSGEVRLSLCAPRPPAERWELWVDDDGPGLPVEDPEELFKPFVSRREGGSGLGLVVARASLRAMGGELELSARPEGGTRARFRLPPDAGLGDAPDAGERTP